MAAMYNQIGNGYDATRCADPEILNAMARLLSVREGRLYVDVACGTGNYTVELARHFCSDAELQSGLLRLKADIETGAVQSVIHQYENDLGDYCFIFAEKMVN